MSRSRRSLIVQPAPRKSNAPHPNSANILKSGRCPGGAANVIDLQHIAYKIRNTDENG